MQRLSRHLPFESRATVFTLLTSSRLFTDPLVYPSVSLLALEAPLLALEAPRVKSYRNDETSGDVSHSVDVDTITASLYKIAVRWVSETMLLTRFRLQLDSGTLI